MQVGQDEESQGSDMSDPTAAFIGFDCHQTEKKLIS